MLNNKYNKDAQILERYFKNESVAQTFLEKVTFIKPSDPLLENIDELNKLQSPLSVPYIVPLLLADEAIVRDSATSIINKLLESTSPEIWAVLDERIRGNSYKYNGNIVHKWWRIEPDKVNHYLKQASCSTLLLKMFSCHSNGYVREKAINLIGGQQAYLPQLLVRANDWVTKVRLKSYAGVWQCLEQLSDEKLIDHLFLFDRLKNQLRHDHSDLIDYIAKRLNETENRSLLLVAVKSYNHKLARIVFGLLSQSKISKDDLIDINCNASDALVRAKTIKVAETTLQDDYLYQFLCAAKNDPVPGNKKRVFYIFIEKYSKEALPHLERLLLNKSYSLRDFARFYLKEVGIKDFKTFYLTEVVKNTEQLKYAIIGLSEVCEAADWHHIQAFIEHENTSIQQAVLEAATKLKVDDTADICISMIKSDEQSNKLKAIKLQKRYALISLPSLEQQLASSTSLADKLVWATLITRLNKWSGLIYLLTETSYNLENELVWQAVSSWFETHTASYYFYPPKSDVVAKLSGLYQVLENELNHTAEVAKLKDLVSLLQK